jgi:hypothetical protein
VAWVPASWPGHFHGLRRRMSPKIGYAMDQMKAAPADPWRNQPDARPLSALRITCRSCTGRALPIVQSLEMCQQG